MAKYIGRSRTVVLPEGVTYHRDMTGGYGILCRAEEATECWAGAESREVAACHRRAHTFPSPVTAPEAHHSRCTLGTDRREGARPPPQIGVVRVRARTAVRCPNHPRVAHDVDTRDPVRLEDLGRRAQKEGVEDTEDPRIRADAEGEDENDGDGEAGGAPQGAEGVAEVLEKSVHPATASLRRSPATHPSKSSITRSPYSAFASECVT